MTHVDPLNFVSIVLIPHNVLFVSIKTDFNVEYKFSLCEIYLLVFFKEEFKFFGRLFIKYLLTS